MVDKTKMWDFAAGLLDKADEFFEDKIEGVFGAFSNFLQGRVDDTETKFDNKALMIIEIGIRDRLIKKYPLDKYPVD